MKQRKILRIAAACCLAVLIGWAAPVLAFAEGEETYLSDLSLELQTSYKKTNEFNPLYTQRFGADPGVMEYEGRLYVYMTADIIERDASGAVKENSYQYIRSLNCISSDDLVNWTDHGEIRVAGINGAARWAGNSWAPCAAHKTIDGQEKFFLYFCNGGNGIGVLTADSPTGPWKDELGHLLISRNTKNCGDVVWLFDPAVMVDDDGTGYLAFGGGVPSGKQAAPGTARIVRLGEDMVSLDGDPVRLDVPWLFEDSGINKIGGKYVYSDCSNWQTGGNSLRLTDGAIQYMTADDPLGPYTYQGELFPNEGRFFGLYGNNHHSIVSLNGEYYLFYHSRPVEKAMGITGNYRSPQINAITVQENGKLKQVVGTMKGVPQLKTVDPYAPVSGSTMSHQAGITVKTMANGVQTQTSAGSWLRVTGVNFGEGASQMKVTAASAEGCTVYVVAGSLDSPVAAKIDIPARTDAAEYAAACALSGVQDVYFVFDGEASFYAWQAE